MAASSSALEAARAELEEAGGRARKIAGMIVAKEAALEARKRTRAGKGSGRMPDSEQRIENKLNADLKHLRAGYFPEERIPTARAPIAQVFGSAQQNSQHHAGGLSAPSGRPRNAGGGDDGGDDGCDDGGGGGDDACTADEDFPDDGEADPAFTHFYRVSSSV
jgi:hypothetical protein